MMPDLSTVIGKQVTHIKATTPKQDANSAYFLENFKCKNKTVKSSAMIAVCKPETTNKCEMPASLKSDFVSLSIPCCSPNNMALAMLA